VSPTSAGRQVRLKASSLQLRGMYADLPGVCCSLTDVTDYADRIISNDRQTKWVRDMGNTLFVERGGGMPSSW
jgi:hypothetical protein